MIKKLKKAHLLFVMHFDYCPNFPPNLDFNQEEYAELLLKCIEDDFDYTIEKYGTVVPKTSSLRNSRYFLNGLSFE